MSELTPKDIAAWHLEQAKIHEEIAKRHNEMAISVERDFNMPPTRFQLKLPPSGNGSPVTAAQLEEAVRNAEKMGRIWNFAGKLNTTFEVIEGLLEPKSKVYRADRGWLKLRE